MGYTPRIYDPKEGMIAICNAIEKFDEKRFLYALQYKNFDEDEIELMAKQVAEYRIKLEKEYVLLLKFAKTFNKRFVTENNKCFDTAVKLLQKMRSGMSEIKRIYLKFCPRWNSKHYPNNGSSNNNYSAYDKSLISEDSIQLSAFGFDLYPPCVKGLYNELSQFFDLMSKSLSLCLSVIKEEERIREDAGYCNYLYKDFKRKMLREIWGIIKMFKTEHEDLSSSNNPAIASREQFSSTEDWAPHGFHRFEVSDVQKLVIKEVIEEEEREGLTKEEIRLFGSNRAFVHQIRNIIWHFDELLPEDFNRKKLDSTTIALFMIWCRAKDEGLFVEYFNLQYTSNPNHKHETVTKSAVNTAKNNLITTDKDGSLQKQLAKRIADLHILPSAKQNMAI